MSRAEAIGLSWLRSDDSCAAFHFRLAWNLGCDVCELFPLAASQDYYAGRSLRTAMEHQLQLRIEWFDPTCLFQADIETLGSAP